jgi:thioester reductase-like protein
MADSFINYNFNQELHLDPSIKTFEPWKGIIMKHHIFLTGATGFLGSHLLIQLLHTTKAHIYCLCRKESYEKFSQQLLTTPLSDQERSRVHPLLGDLALTSMGLDHQTYTQLTQTIDLIYHCAACVNIGSYEQVRQITLDGTKNLLQFACTGPIKPLCAISSLGVYMSVNQLGQTCFEEKPLFHAGTGLMGSYTQSKWVSEHLIHLATQRGLPTCVIRPTRISLPIKGPTLLKRDDTLSTLIKTLIKSKSAPNLSLSLGFIPVDILSESIVALSLEPSSYGHCFNFVHNSLISIETLISFLEIQGYRVKLKPYNEWLIDFKAQSPVSKSHNFFTQPIYNNLSYFECMQFFKDDYFSNKKLVNQLKKIKTLITPTTDQILMPYLKEIRVKT